ncbi:hypothetical protein [Actinomadura sp. CNU-125]|nr:hypothetical protein [Actinomadura sp. CNU-125]
MTHVKIAIIGAGSGYMPGVVRGLLHRATTSRAPNSPATTSTPRNWTS